MKIQTTAEVEGSSSSLRLSRSIPLRSFQWLPLVHITFNIIVIAIIIVVIVNYQQGTHTRAWCLESKAWPLVNSPPITVVHPPHRYSSSSSSWWFWMILIEIIGDPSIISQLMAGYHMVGVGPQHPTFLPRCLTIVMCLDIFYPDSDIFEYDYLKWHWTTKFNWNLKFRQYCSGPSSLTWDHKFII